MSQQFGGISFINVHFFKKNEGKSNIYTLELTLDEPKLAVKIT